MADALEANAPAILAANAQDLEAAQGTIAPVMQDRLRLTQGRIADMAAGVRAVAALPDPVGRTLASHTLPNGLQVNKVSVPLGVIAIIYESRPNVTSDAASLTFQAGSVCVLRGGKESIHVQHRHCGRPPPGPGKAPPPRRPGEPGHRHHPGTPPTS